MDRKISVDLTVEEYREVMNILQLIAVLGVQLQMPGLYQPSKPVLLCVFENLFKAGFESTSASIPQVPDKEGTNKKIVLDLTEEEYKKLTHTLERIAALSPGICMNESTQSTLLSIFRKTGVYPQIYNNETCTLYKLRERIKGEPPQVWIMRHFKESVDRGLLLRGGRVLDIHQLANAIDVPLSTVNIAYRALVEEGVFSIKDGCFYVAEAVQPKDTSTPGAKNDPNEIWASTTWRIVLRRGEHSDIVTVEIWPQPWKTYNVPYASFNSPRLDNVSVITFPDYYRNKNVMVPSQLVTVIEDVRKRGLTYDDVWGICNAANLLEFAKTVCDKFLSLTQKENKKK